MTKGEKVIVVSEMIREYVLKNYKIDRKKLILNYRGVSDKIFAYNYKAPQNWLKKWHKDFPQTRNKIILTLPGRITRWKGQDDFLIVLKGIIKKYPNVHGLIVGDEDKNLKFTKELKALVIEHGLNQNISFVGNRKDIKEIMSISRIVFSLSKEPEAFGTDIT
jgi:glycosyltransferase involved in cell wall biosynthesis